MKIKTKDIVLCAVFAALTAIGAFIKIPIPVCPITLQFLFTMMAGFLLGSKKGGLSIIIYIVIGLIGVPIFANGGGIGYVFVPTFGYLIGFAVQAFVIGAIVEHMKTLSFIKLFAASIAGLIVLHVIGLLYYYLISSFALSEPVSVFNIFYYCFVLTVPGDIVLCIIGAILSKRLIPILKKENAYE